MAWVYLLLAGLFEVGWAIGLKSSNGFTRLWPSVATIVAMAISLTLLGLSLKSLPIGTAYSIWTGIGAVGTVMLGIMLFGESASVGRLVCVGLILSGIVGLKVLSKE
jgi:quaternary ammonium compound-resistance protein SugE